MLNKLTVKMLEWLRVALNENKITLFTLYNGIKIFRKGKKSMNTMKLYPQRYVLFDSNMTLCYQEIAGVAFLL
jgi:hypothetical protein